MIQKRRLSFEDIKMLWKLAQLLATIALVAGVNLSSTSALAPSRPSLVSTTAPRSKEAAAFAVRRGLRPVSASSSISETIEENPMSEALQSMRKCYRACFFASAVDVTITFIENIRSKIFSVRGLLNLHWTDYVNILDSITLLIFAIGVQRVATVYQRWVDGEQGRKSDESLATYFSVMCWFWRVVALDYACNSLVDASVLPQMSMKWLGLHHVSPSSIMKIVAGATLLSYFVVNSYCAKIAFAEDAEDDKRINASQRESKTQSHFKSIRLLGYHAFRGQALAVAACSINSCMKLIKLLVAADTGLVARAMSLLEMTEPLVVTLLLLGLNKAFLRAAIVRSREQSKATAEKDGEVYNDLFTAQTQYYTKLGGFVKKM